MSLDKRSAARLAVVQALYQMDVARKGVNEIFAEFEAHWIGREIEGVQYKPAELEFFRDVVRGVLEHQAGIDRRIDAALQGSWPLTRIEAIMRAILRAGAYELEKRPDVPARAAIKEYVDVTGAFFGPAEAGMVNAVLDRIARSARPDEFEARA